MRRSRHILTVITVVIAALAVTAAAGATPGPDGWGTARWIPGTLALNSGDQATVAAVSCRPVGNCGAGGSYTDSAGNRLPFVATQTSGRWGTAQQVPGIAALVHGGGAWILSLSCGAAGSCAAGGGYFDDATHTIGAFITTQRNGAWGTAQRVAKTLSQGGGAVVESLSCPAAGQCSAGGYYTASHVGQQAFVVSETNGAWGTAEQVPGLAALSQGDAAVSSVSCAAAGQCSAGGYFYAASGRQAFVASQAKGVWGSAEQVPGTAALNQGGGAQIGSLSCAAAGQCSAGGYYTDSQGHLQPFVASETSGIWGTAEQVPGIAALNKNEAEILSLSCAAAGECSAGGFYTTPSQVQAFVVSESSGVWGQAEEVPGTAALNKGGIGELDAVSCAAAGDCSAVGDYTNNDDRQPVFVVSETNGIWGTAQPVPGIKTLNRGYALMNSLSCDPVAHCTAGGLYTGYDDRQQTLVVSQT